MKRKIKNGNDDPMEKRNKNLRNQQTLKIPKE
jgi:hypothetical protein